MLDKEFWTESYSNCLNILLKRFSEESKRSVRDICNDKYVGDTFEDICSTATLFASISLDYFKNSMKELSKESKKEIISKEHSKQTYK